MVTWHTHTHPTVFFISKMIANRNLRDQVLCFNPSWWKDILKFCTQDNENFILRNFELLRQVNMPTAEEDICKFYCGEPIQSMSIKLYNRDFVSFILLADVESKTSKFSSKQDVTKLEVCSVCVCVRVCM